MDAAIVPQRVADRTTRRIVSARARSAMLVLLAATLAWQGPVGATVVLPSPPLAAGAQAPAEADPATRGEGVLVDSAAVRDVFDPLPGVGAAGGAYWQAALATLPDPVESRLARSFDIEVATLVRSFQSAATCCRATRCPGRSRRRRATARHRVRSAARPP